MSTGTQAPRIVLDASAVMRAAVDRSDAALEWLARVEAGTVEASWPDLALVEIAHGLARLARSRRLTTGAALGLLARILAGPIEVEPVGPVTLPAAHVALERGLSVSDAAYVVLAETRQSTLVTADRRLATATPNAVLLDC